MKYTVIKCIPLSFLNKTLIHQRRRKKMKYAIVKGINGNHVTA